MLNKKTNALYIILLLIGVSCTANLNEECKIRVIRKSITLPKEYSLIECNKEEDTGMLSVKLKFLQPDVDDFLKKNTKFTTFKRIKLDGIQTPHYIFFNRLSENFKDLEKVDVKKTYYYHTKDDKDNYLTFLLNYNGDLFIVLEKGGEKGPE